MKENLTQILMNEAIREGWREWMAKVRTVLPQTDAERPVTWIAAERLARDHGRMVRLVELLREHRPVLSFRVQEEAGLLILVAYHRHGGSADFLLDTAEAYFREKDCGGFLFLCRNAGKHQRLRRIPAPERALQPSGGTAVPLPP